MSDPHLSEAEALASLFLGDSETVRSSLDPTVEAVVLGHLPVLASAWLTPYARELSDDIGAPVGLARLRGGDASIAMIGSSAPASASLEEAIAEAGVRAGAWVVCADDVELSRLVACQELSRVTVLSGVDEAAIVSCYRTLKELADVADGPSLRVVLFGATDSERSREATERLKRATANFLRTSVEIMTCTRKIDHDPATILFRGPCDLDVEHVIDLIDDVPLLDVMRVDRPSGVPVARTVKPPMASPVMAPIVTPVVIPAATAVKQDDSAYTGSQAMPSGLTALAWRCPEAPGVSLAFDRRGGVCVLAWCEADPGPAVVSLASARAWAAANLALIAAASAGVVKESVAPTAHLITTRPDLSRSLMATETVVHGAARGGDGAWVTMTLNARPGA